MEVNLEVTALVGVVEARRYEERRKKWEFCVPGSVKELTDVIFETNSLDCPYSHL
jgi:hypothetical protein